MKTKLFTLLLAVVANIGTIFADYVTVDGIRYSTYYYYDTGVATASVISSGSSFVYTGTKSIPSSIKYNYTWYSVTSIGEGAFQGCTGLTSVTIPSSVTSIGSEAFSGCTGLASLTIPSSVTRIRSNAFKDVANIIYSGSESGSPWGARSVNGYVNGNFVYRDNTQTTLLACFTSAHGDIIIPNSVTSIGNGAFKDCSSVTSVTIPNSVTSIGGNAFEGCSGLATIVVEDGNLEYDSRNNCNALIESSTNILVLGCKNSIIPNSVTSIGSRAFKGCADLVSITIPNSVTSIGEYAFYACSGLTSITIPSSVTSIENFTFSECSGLTSVTIPNSVTSIGNGAFKDCSGVTSITIPNKVTSIGNSAFEGCSGLTSETIPNSVTSIGDNAFSGCSNMNVVYIGNSVISIGQGAFYNCSALYKIIMLPNTVPSGINDAFSELSGRITYVGNTNYQSGYDALGTQRIYSNLNSYFTVDGIVYALVNPSKRTCDIIDCDYSGATTEFSIGNSVVYRNITLSIDSINRNAFRNNKKMTKLNIDYNNALPSHMASYCTNLTKVVINNHSDIDTSAFSSCESIDTLIITANVGHIRSSAFSYCSRNVNAYYTINNSGNIGAGAFYYCNKLYHLVIGDSVKNIDSSAFYKCYGIANADIHNNGSIGSSAFNYSSTQDPATYHIHNNGLISNYAFANCSSITNLTIDTCVTTIGNYAFQSCSSLEEVTIKNKGDIGTHAFAGSSTQNPATYTISNVGSIGTSAFANCSSITNLTIDTCVITIGDYAFQSCSSLEEVTIKNKGDIGTHAFAGSSTQDPATYHIHNNGLISNYAFANCSSITNLTIDTCVTTIGNYAFQSCSSLEEVTIKNKGDIGTHAFAGSSIQNPAIYNINNVGIIGTSAFANCTKLHKARFGNQVSRINQSAFSNCVLLDSVTLPNIVNILEDSAFYNCSLLAYAKLSNQLSSIGKAVFAHCSSLPELSIPKSVSSIGNSTFHGCSALSIVSFEDGSAPLSLGINTTNQGLFYDCPLDSLYIGRELTYTQTASNGYSPFYRNLSLRSIVISDFPAKVETNEFYGCTKLYSVYIGNGVTSIGDYAFSGCSSIDYFSFGNQVQTIGAEAFSDCVAMTRLYSYCQVPPTCGTSALADIDKWSCTLYVPKGTVSTYAEADQWMDFFFVEENEGSGDGTKYTISVDFDSSKGNVTGAGIYDRGAEAVLIATPAAGYVFVGWEDGSTNPERHISVFKSATYTATFSVPTDVDALDEEEESMGVVYDILGRPVASPSHGIYIRNGEKILVK